MISAAMLMLFLAQPAPEHGLHYIEPAQRWDEAMPLGNGTLGALVWGGGDPLNISLDRTGLWDLRPVPEFHTPAYDWRTMQEWEAEGRVEELLKLYDEPYHRPAPTKIPAGRIALEIGRRPVFEEARLDIAAATATTTFEGGAEAEVWVHATEPAGFIQVRGAARVKPDLQAPAFGGKEPGEARPAISMGELAQLGYPPPVRSGGEQWAAYEQEGWGGFRFAVYLGWRQGEDGTWTGAWSVASSLEGVEPLERARVRVETVLDGRLPELRATHEAWWRDYWAASSVRVPDAPVERQYYLDMYKFGAASRRGAPPITLQGPWTADDGKLPPWKGDYHHDLNTELSYWPCYAGNHLEEGLAFLDWLWATRYHCVDWTRRFYKLPGMNVPMTADLDNRQIGGWRQYTHSATTACWLAHHFDLHWQFSGDRTFLEQRAYPYLRDAAVFIEAVTVKGEDGLRRLPLSSSPEIHDNKPEAWFKDTFTNYDLALVRWLAGATAEMAEELGRADEAARWRALLGEFPEFALDEDGGLLVAPGEALAESHRHFSHLMAIHPLGLVDPGHGEAAARTVRASLAHLEKLGSSLWTGYSFSWLASMAARAGDGDAAARALQIFAEAFVLRSSFHCNGDQSGKGYSNFTYRPFTLEGNFAAAAGLQEMLLQSHRGIIEVFPAIPESWKDVSFRQLRARGGFLVSAAMTGGRPAALEIQAEHGGACAVRLPDGSEIETPNLRPGEIWRADLPPRSGE